MLRLFLSGFMMMPVAIAAMAVEIMTRIARRADALFWRWSVAVYVSSLLRAKKVRQDARVMESILFSLTGVEVSNADRSVITLPLCAAMPRCSEWHAMTR